MNILKRFRVFKKFYVTTSHNSVTPTACFRHNVTTLGSSHNGWNITI